MNTSTKKTVTAVGILVITIFVVFLFAADIVSLTGLQGNILNIKSGIFETRMPNGTIAATVNIPTEIVLVNQNDFTVPITLIPHRNAPEYVEATVFYDLGIVAEHHYSAFMKDDGSTLFNNIQEVRANIVNTPSEGEPLFRLKGILTGETGKIRIELVFQKENQSTSLITTEVEIRKGEPSQ